MSRLSVGLVLDGDGIPISQRPAKDVEKNLKKNAKKDKILSENVHVNNIKDLLTKTKRCSAVPKNRKGRQSIITDLFNFTATGTPVAARSVPVMEIAPLPVKYSLGNKVVGDGHQVNGIEGRNINRSKDSSSMSKKSSAAPRESKVDGGSIVTNLFDFTENGTPIVAEYHVPIENIPPSEPGRESPPLADRDLIDSPIARNSRFEETQVKQETMFTEYDKNGNSSPASDDSRCSRTIRRTLTLPTKLTSGRDVSILYNPVISKVTEKKGASSTKGKATGGRAKKSTTFNAAVLYEDSQPLSRIEGCRLSKRLTFDGTQRRSGKMKLLKEVALFVQSPSAEVDETSPSVTLCDEKLPTDYSFGVFISLVLILLNLAD